MHCFKRNKPNWTLDESTPAHLSRQNEICPTIWNLPVTNTENNFSIEIPEQKNKTTQVKTLVFQKRRQNQNFEKPS